MVKRIDGEPGATQSWRRKRSVSARSRATPEFTEFVIPQALLKSRRIVVDWRDPAQPPSTSALRFGPYVAEVWLLKK